jgi:hypothetical protein
MDNQNKCNEYEGFFVFKDENSFLEHLEHCSDCKKEHEKYKKVSELIKEVAPVYLEKQKNNKHNAMKKLACCFVVFIGLSAFTGYKIFDNYTINSNLDDESYITTLGLPTDDYGLLEI